MGALPFMAWGVGTVPLGDAFGVARLLFLGHAMLVSSSSVVPTLVSGSMGRGTMGGAKQRSAQGHEPTTPIPEQLHPPEKQQFSGEVVSSPWSLLARVPWPWPHRCGCELREAAHYLLAASQQGLSCLSSGGNPALRG